MFPTISNHASPRTTKLHDRRSDEIALDEVEKIAIYRYLRITSYAGRTLKTVKESLELREFGWDVQTVALVSCSVAKHFGAEPDKVGELVTAPPVVFPWRKFEIV